MTNLFQIDSALTETQLFTVLTGWYGSKASSSFWVDGFKSGAKWYVGWYTSTPTLAFTGLSWNSNANKAVGCLYLLVVKRAWKVDGSNCNSLGPAICEYKK